jgi:hypothetical protein
MVGTVIFPTLSGRRRAGSRRQQVAGLMLLPDGNGLVPWLPARAAWLAGPGPRRWSWTRRAGRVPVLRNPDQLQPGRALDSLSIRA